ncbi:MAG: hypothetical protein Q8L51_02465 [Candidatus Amesbacteria bacterium]|nr:hypothetical protein [Candidatus Amesbacteria bacterium]
MIDRPKTFAKDRLIATLIGSGIGLLGFAVMFINASPENIVAFSTGFAVFAVGIGAAFYNYLGIKPIDS